VLRLISPKTNVNGVSFNRKYQALRGLEKAGFPVQVIYYNPIDDDEFYMLLKEFKPQIYFECSPSASEITKIKFIKEHCPEMRVILDFDDAPADKVLPSNPAYAYCGEAEAGEWKDRVTKALFSGYEVMFDVERNKRNNARILEMKSLADVTIVPTQRLKDEMKNKKTVIIPNTINFDLYDAYKFDTDTVRIGWVLGFSHIADWTELKDSLASVLNEHENTEFILWSNTILPLDNFPIDRVEKYDTIGVLDGYFNLFSNLNLDIGIAYVADNEFNSFKSNLKILEYGAIKAMPLASKKLYGEYIDDTVNGVVYADATDFRHKLSYYIRNAKERREIAENAFQNVKDNYNFEDVLPKYFELFLETAESV